MKKIQYILPLLAGVLFPIAEVEAAQGPMPPICNRGCWAARAPTCGITQMSSLNRAIIHHTAGASDYNTSGLEASKAIVRNVQNLHINNGWCDIAYHFLVDKHGNVFEGRSGSMSGLPRGTHDSANSSSFGFNLLGYYHTPYNNNPTDVSRGRLYDVIAWRMPSAWSPYGSGGGYCGSDGCRTVGWLDSHRNVKSTACPGDLLHNPFITSNYGGGEARNGVNARKNGTVPPPVAGIPPRASSQGKNDFNGDGRADIISFVRGGGNSGANIKDGDVYVALSGGGNFGGGARWNEFFCIGEEVPDVGDFNGDGKSDIVLFKRGTGTAAGVGDVMVSLSSGAGFGGAGLWNDFFCIGDEVPMVGDFNGDGKDDIATFILGGGNNAAGVKDGDVIVSLSNGAGFLGGAKWNEFFCIGNEVPGIGDVNGDGRDDLICFVRGGGNTAAGVPDGDIYVALSTGTGFGGGQKWHEFFCMGAEMPAIADINGDGKADVLTFLRGTGTAANVGDVIVSLSSGAGFVGAAKWQEFFCIGGELPGAADFTGDGKADLVTFVRGGGNPAANLSDGDVHVAVATGTGFGGGARWSEFFCIGSEIPLPASAF